MAKNDVYKQIRNILDGLDKSVDYIAENSGSEAMAQDVSSRILKTLTTLNPRYNDYSGNLTRSFFVYFKLGGEEYLYVSDPNVAKQPDTQIYGGRTTNYKGFNGVIFRPKGRSEGRKIITYKIQKKRHAKTKKGRYVRNYRENRKRPRENDANTAHQYIEEIPKPYRYLINTAAAYNGIAVGNYTPYRRFVEGRGYRVLGGGYKQNWSKYIQKMYGQYLNISMKQLAYIFKRGKKQQWTDSYGTPYYFGGKYGQTPIGRQPAGYARASQNARLSYKHRLY